MDHMGDHMSDHMSDHMNNHTSDEMSMQNNCTGMDMGHNGHNMHGEMSMMNNCTGMAMGHMMVSFEVKTDTVIMTHAVSPAPLRKEETGLWVYC